MTVDANDVAGRIVVVAAVDGRDNMQQRIVARRMMQEGQHCVRVVE